MELSANWSAIFEKCWKPSFQRIKTGNKSMKTVIIGGGKGCQAIIALASGSFLKELTLNIQCVVDPDRNAPGMQLARKMKIKTSKDMGRALKMPGIQMVIELTGRNDILENIYRIIPPGMRLIDHTSARIFWDLVNAQSDLEDHLKEITALEEKVEKERRFLQASFDTIPDLVVVLGEDKRIMRVNASFSRAAGISAQGARGKTCSELLETTELSVGCREMSAMVDQTFETGLPRTVVWQTSVPEEAYWEVSFTPILNEDLVIEAIVVTWHRITEKVLLRREVESAEQKFKGFIDSAHDWISIKDLDGRYVIVNPVCAAAFHRKPEDFIGKTVEDMLPDRAPMIKKHDSEAIKTNLHQTYDEIFEIDGRERHYQTARFPLHDYMGQTIGVCTIARDVTAERELHEQLVRAARLAAVGKLAAGVAHEINNPLTGVLAYAEDILEDLHGDDPLRGDIAVIIRETMRCRDIVRNLLDFARQEKLELVEAGPNNIVGQVLSLVQRLPQFRNITIEKNLVDNIPDVWCDLNQIQQVLLNLMINASDAMNENGTIGLSTKYERQHDRCVIAVEDNGPGIPENLIDKIFEPFFSTKGTNGLGLAVSWGIIERHKGIIEVDTAENGGAIFRIVLPAVNDSKNTYKP
jgi:PAS domain S-box-containing protein